MMVGYTTIDGTAISGIDYRGTNGVLYFDDYQMSTNVIVPILRGLSRTTNDVYFTVIITNVLVDTNIFTDIAGNNYVESQALQPTFNSAPMTVLIQKVEGGFGGGGFGGGGGGGGAGTISFLRSHYARPEWWGDSGGNAEIER
jgi:hypothetical protein